MSSNTEDKELDSSSGTGEDRNSARVPSNRNVSSAAPMRTEAEEAQHKEWIRQRNAMYSRKLYHKRKIELEVLEEQVAALRKKQRELRGHHDHLKNLVGEAERTVALHLFNHSVERAGAAPTHVAHLTTTQIQPAPPTSAPEGWTVADLPFEPTNLHQINQLLALQALLSSGHPVVPHIVQAGTFQTDGVASAATVSTLQESPFDEMLRNRPTQEIQGSSPQEVNETGQDDRKPAAAVAAAVKPDPSPSTNAAIGQLLQLAPSPQVPGSSSDGQLPNPSQNFPVAEAMSSLVLQLLARVGAANNEIQIGEEQVTTGKRRENSNSTPAPEDTDETQRKKPL